MYYYFYVKYGKKLCLKNFIFLNKKYKFKNKEFQKNIRYDIILISKILNTEED